SRRAQGPRLRADLPSRQPDAGAIGEGVRARRGTGAPAGAVLLLLRALQDRGDRPADLQAVRGRSHQGRTIRGAGQRGTDPGTLRSRGGGPRKVLDVGTQYATPHANSRSARELRIVSPILRLAFPHDRSYCRTRGE